MRVPLVALTGAVLLAAAAGPAEARPGAIVIPPAEVDLGAGIPIGPGPVGTSTELRAGMHWASLAWKPTRFDLGVGYVGSFRNGAAPVAARTVGEPADAGELAIHGGYLSLSYAIENHRHWRTFVGGRVELLSATAGARSFPALGAAARIATELYAAGVAAGGGSRSGGILAGAWAVGVYVEGIRRGLPDELGPLAVAAGVTMRVPFIAVIAN